MAKRVLEMKYAGGGIVHHLGLKMYKGPITALTELVANAWDADAEKVKISIPLDKTLSSKDEITASDDGYGMTFEECNDKFLVIGRNRREAENKETSEDGRKLMAHKGLGKLSCFGIANKIEIKTVKNKRLTHFVMNFHDIEALIQGESYRPQVIADEQPIEEDDGTTIILKEISKPVKIGKDQFFRSMASRFSILSNEFRVYINEELLKREFGVTVEFRFPEETKDDVEAIKDGMGITQLPCGRIAWWIGFAPEPIKTKDLQGISVITNGKMSQEPWTFDLAGGTTGQHGLQYMIGEITADFLDDGIGKECDHIGTHRSGVIWDDPEARPLYDWAQKKIKQLLRAWVQKRAETRIKDVKQKHPKLVAKIDSFPPVERKELNQALSKLAEVPTLTTDKLVEVFDYVVDGYTDKVLTGVIEATKDLSAEDQVEIIGILKTFDVLEAIRVHKLVVAHVNVINVFSKMIEAGVREKPDMHEHLRKYPWLLGPKYESMDHEVSLDKLLLKRFAVKARGKAGRKRPDFVCFRGGGEILVIELKRPAERVGSKEVSQIAKYVDYLRNWASTSTCESVLGRKINPQDIRGYLIAYDYGGDPTLKAEMARLERDGIFTLKWYDVLRRAKDDYSEFLTIVKARAPKDDPRIRELEQKGLA